MKKKGTVYVLAIAALYILPVLFFAVTYFLQTVSSEDIYQGAGRPISIIEDIQAAFHWNARLGDMYAWPVINFFDYTYKFGVDTIFRLLDVVMAFAIFFLITTIALGRRPRWKVQDALLFGISFLVVFLSDYSRSLVSSFSHIHNYLPTTLLPLLFLLPFIWSLHGREVLAGRGGKLIALVLGLLFALSSNVTPAAFLITAIFVGGYTILFAKRKIKINLRQVINSWQTFAIIGLLVSVFIMYLVGPGVSSYTQGYNGSYVAIGDLLRSPGENGVAIIGNIVHNLQSVAPIIIILGLVVLMEYVIHKKKLMRAQEHRIAGLKFSVLCLVFFVVHVLAVSQIDVSTTTRILLPAYVCAVISVLFTTNRLLYLADVKQKVLLLIATPVIMLTTVLAADMGVVMVQHQKQATAVFERIRNTETNSACVTPADNPTAKSPLMKYYQRELFVDWAMPVTIYDKSVDWCS